MTDRINLLNLTPDDAEARLAAAMAELGQPAYRVGQVLRRLWVTPAASFDAMTELSIALRAALAERFEIPRLSLDDASSSPPTAHGSFSSGSPTERRSRRSRSPRATG